MIALRQEVFALGQQQFPLKWVAAHAEWKAEDWESAQDLGEYEAKLNLLLPPYRNALLCLYDLAKI